MRTRFVVISVLSLFLAALDTAPAVANHRWGSYHWAQAQASTDPAVSVALGSNLVATSASAWPQILGSVTSTGTTAFDWTELDQMHSSSRFANDDRDILNTPVILGANADSQKRCKPFAGRIEVCNARYGRNGWLGLAQIWTSGGHIVQGVAKLNDTYFDDTLRYPRAVMRQHVLCQEIGHGFGLDHQDESGNDLNTCMDYARSLDNGRPDLHDNHTLNVIYRDHTDPASASGTTAAGNGQGKARRLRDDLYVETAPNGVRIFTFVTWVDDAAAARAPHDRVPE